MTYLYFAHTRLMSAFGLLALSFTSHLAATQPEHFSHTATTTWQEFSNEKNSAKDKKNKKWVWVSCITLKSKQAVKLKKITLKWCGEKIPNLFASLFKKYKHADNVIPIERNLISDGSWNSEKQQIVFSLDNKVVATQRYYLVLNYAKGIEDTLKKGHFALCDVSCQE